MIALRQLKRVPKNHQIIIEVPDTIDENQILEIILLFKTTPKNTKADKIAQLKNSQSDALFLQDLQAMNDHFSDIDTEEWQ